MDDREVAISAAKKRMAAFRLRQAPLAGTPTGVVPEANHHARSHSRNNSITNFPLSASTVHNASPADETLENSSSVPSSPSPRSRPNSHHRRRSSVSTRRESAEMMGVPLSSESLSDSTSDPTELRSLALWTLEGKGRSDNTFIGGFTKVEIPELNAPETEGNVDALQVSKPRPTLSSFGMGNSVVGKRDSFGKLLMSSSNSIKDQLHTLMEEEEEEENEAEKEHETTPIPSESSDSFRDQENFRIESLPRKDIPSQPISASNRHRPANLTLRPLSLTPESLPMKRTEVLPTPSPTPSPRLGGGLRALTLTPSPSPAPSHSSTSSTSSVSSCRQSMSVSPSPQNIERVQHRMSLGSAPSPNPTAPLPTRKSSISYKRTPSVDRSNGYLPTPGPTPTSPQPPPLHSSLMPASNPLSCSGTVTDLERPLSPTEQAFLFRSHTSLLCRISDLEKAIAGGGGRLPPGAGVPGTEFCIETRPSRSPSHDRPMSVSSTPSTSESEPSDEMMQFVADLKSERDELMRDATGWRTRTADLEHQVGTLTRRVEAERREGWVVRERLGVVEVEKKRMQEEAEHARLEGRKLEMALQTEVEVRVHAEEARDAETALREEAEREAEALRREVALLHARLERAHADLRSLLPKPKVDMRLQMPFVRRFDSLDSGASGSTTDVEEYVPLSLRTLQLHAVAEEEERDLPRDVTSEGGNGSELDEDNEDELAHYEDEGLDDDLIFSDDQTSSSFGSMARSNSHLIRLDLAAVGPAQGHEPAPVHSRAGSMERGWSFPAQPGSVKRAPQKVDRFFECLDALDESDAEPDGGMSTYDSITAKQFWRAAAQAEDGGDELPPFVIPAQPSPPRREKEWKELEGAKLEVVAEEEEDDSISFQFPVWTKNSSSEATEGSKVEPVTPRLQGNSLAPASTPTKAHRTRQTSDDLKKIPGFKPYSGSVPVLKAPPPPRRSTSPAKTLPPSTTNVEAVAKQASPTQIPQPSRASPSPSFTPAAKARGSLTGTTLIPRLSTSPKQFPTTSTPTKSVGPATMTMSTPTPATKTVTPPAFISQPRPSGNPVTRSSILPPSIEPRVLTRLTISQTQGLTAKLSQQMQSFTNLLSPWSVRASTNAQPDRLSRGFVGKDRQVERLRMRLQREGGRAAPCAHCASCRGDIIEI